MEWSQYKKKYPECCCTYSWRNNVSHLVYFITDGNGMVKIGITGTCVSVNKRKVEKERLVSAAVVRLKQIQTGNPHPLKIYRLIWCKEHWMAFEIEKLLHEKFKGVRSRGEWFDFSQVKIYVNSFTIKDGLFLDADTVFNDLSNNLDYYKDYLCVDGE